LSVVMIGVTVHQVVTSREHFFFLKVVSCLVWSLLALVQYYLFIFICSVPLAFIIVLICVSSFPVILTRKLQIAFYYAKLFCIKNL
jgi:hypothetical protein